jgi:cardiolipin synthase A/B
VTSLNLTRKCFRKTCDAIVVTHDPEVVASLRRLMAADRDALQLPSGLSPRLIIGPGPARGRFTSLIEQARTSIRLIDAKLADPDLVALLKRRRSDGIAVDVYSARRLGALKSHGKIMLVDDTTLVVGSLALAALSLDFRREVAITVDEPTAIAQAMELFAAVEADQRADDAIAPGGASC